MNSDQMKFTHNLPHCYLEVARASAGPLSLHHPVGSLEGFVDSYGHNPIANATFSIVSISIIYSFLAVESFVNYQLYRLWERRHDKSHESRKFLQVYGDEHSFEGCRGHKKFRDLKDRYKTFCKIMSFASPSDRISKVWQEFNDLARVTRHFLVHPSPSPDEFDELMSKILTEFPSGTYPRIASELIGYLYDQSGMQRPIWLSENTLIAFRGVDILVGKNDDRPNTPLEPSR